jgi:hypothetical protein
MKTTAIPRRVKQLTLVLLGSGALLISGTVSASAAPARSAAPAIPAQANCAAHDWCAYSVAGFDPDGNGTEWVWSNYSYNHWYYVGSGENDQWRSWISGRGWTTGIGLNYPESTAPAYWACVTGGARVGSPGDYPGTSRSESASVSSVNFFNTSNGVACP